MGALLDEVTVFTAAARWAAHQVDALPESAWDGPGLGGWDMRALVGHSSRALLTVEQYLPVPAESENVTSAEGYYEVAARLAGADPAAVLQRGVDAGAALGSDPKASFRAIAERVPALLAGEHDRVVTTIVGGIRLSNYLPTRTFELVVHGLDITTAAGLPSSPPDAALRRCIDLAASLAICTGRGPTLLLAMTGRAQLPADFWSL